MSKNKKIKKIKRLKEELQIVKRTLEYQNKSADNAWEYVAEQSDAVGKLLKAVKLVAEAAEYHP